MLLSAQDGLGSGYVEVEYPREDRGMEKEVG
jgi:hypothetical protein